ncbi:MAG: menaquinone biosynthesis protein [Bacteroidetes bacterium]|nr:menaquinone biosynthesis protein [Bacteroidota bacterium]
MLKKLKVSAVSYLNTKPFLYGIFKDRLDEHIDLQLDVPSVCAQKLIEGKVDIGLVPVAVIPQLKNPQIISDYCIGTEGRVKTVCIFSNCPLEEVSHLYLDYHSRTSSELVKILLEKHWKVAPKTIPEQMGFDSQIQGTHAALVIGDRAIRMYDEHPFVYDLGEAWMNFTGLPFVFAAWVSNEPLEEKFLRRFNNALKMGIDDIPQLTHLLPSPVVGFDLKRYFTGHISYAFDDLKRKALSLFLQTISSKKSSPSIERTLMMGSV